MTRDDDNNNNNNNLIISNNNNNNIIIIIIIVSWKAYIHKVTIPSNFKLRKINRHECLFQILAQFVLFPPIFITFVEAKGTKSCSPSYWCGSVFGELILTVFHYFTPMVFIVSSATSVRTQRAVKAIPRDEAAPHCQNFTLEGLVFERTDFCLLVCFS